MITDSNSVAFIGRFHSDDFADKAEKHDVDFSQYTTEAGDELESHDLYILPKMTDYDQLKAVLKKANIYKREHEVNQKWRKVRNDMEPGEFLVVDIENGDWEVKQITDILN